MNTEQAEAIADAMKILWTAWREVGFRIRGRAGWKLLHAIDYLRRQLLEEKTYGD